MHNSHSSFVRVDWRMANFKGHALPGSCFLLLGLCWSVIYPLRHCWRRHQPKGRQKLPLFFNRIDLIEGALMTFFAFVGESSLVHLFGLLSL